MKINTREALEQVRNNLKSALKNQSKQILICAGTGCMAGGSLKIYEKFKGIIEENGLNLELSLKKDIEHSKSTINLISIRVV